MGFVTFIDLTWSVTTALFSNHYLTQQVFAELLTEFDHYMCRSEVVLPLYAFLVPVFHVMCLPSASANWLSGGRSDGVQSLHPRKQAT